MKRLFSFSVTSTITFILSVLAILVIAVSAPGMVQAVLGPGEAPASPSGNSIQASDLKAQVINPAAQIGTLADTGIFGTAGIGIASPVSPLHIYSTSSTQPETIDLDGAQPITAQWNDYSNTGGAFSGSGFLARFAHGTRASPSNVAAGDRLGFNVFGGWAGTGFKHTAAIEAIVGAGTISDTSLPTYMKFSTTPNGSSTRVEAMRISSSGNVGINTASPSALSKLHVVNDNEAVGASAIFAQEIAGSDTAGIIGRYGNPGSGTRGLLGATQVGVYGVNETANNHGFMGGTDYGVKGESSSGNFGYLGTDSYGVEGSYSGDNTTRAGVYGHSDNSAGGLFNSTNNNGLFVSHAGFDGVSVQDAGRYGGFFRGTDTAVFAQSRDGNLFVGRDEYPFMDVRFKVDNAGNVTADGTYSSPASDFAETLPAAGALEPGDVLLISANGKLARSANAYSTAVAGVYSTKPGFMGGAGDDADLTGKVPLAVVGVVPVKASAENGSICPGDLLCTSNTAGHAMKATEPQIGAVLGKALESLKSGTGTIKVLITLQ